ncbi:hypothetical protein OFN55_42890, partial [Escherichia coli]|nr:hypothetical protein [Escherichia coli]
RRQPHRVARRVQPRRRVRQSQCWPDRWHPAVCRLPGPRQRRGARRLPQPRRQRARCQAAAVRRPPAPAGAAATLTPQR